MQALQVLTDEADFLVQLAKRYRTEMKTLPDDDSRKNVYEGVIRDLLARSELISKLVTDYCQRI